MITMESSLWLTPGVQTWRKAARPMVGGRQPKKIAVWDLDMTVSKTDSHMEAHVLPWHDDHASELGVPNRLVRQATGPFEDRSAIRSIEYLWVELALHLGELFPLLPQALLDTVIKPYFSKWLEIESRITAFDGIAEEMGKFQERWPDALNLVITNCPTWMGLGRCHHTGILPHIHGIIGVEADVPEIGQDHPYWPCVQYARDWMRRIINPNGSHAHQHLQLIAGVPWRKAKPDSLGLELVMDWADPIGTLPTLSFGDNPESEGKVAALVSGKRPANPVQYLHTRWHQEVPTDVSPQGVTIRAALDSPRELLPTIQGCWAA